MNLVHRVLEEMIRFDAGDPRRIQHFLKVWGFAKWIGENEGLDAQTQCILEVTALVHDIGIHPAEQKYGRCDGKLQEQEGPAPARQLLQALDADDALIDRVCYLVGHHHTYHEIQGLDYQILVEADFLVNLYEDGVSADAVQAALTRVFRTASGTQLCRQMFGLVCQD